MTTAPATSRSTRIEVLLGAQAADLLGHTRHTVPAELLHRPGPDFVTCAGHRATARYPCCAACRPCSTMGVSPAPGTCRSCRLTRASSTRQVHPSLLTRCTLTGRRSSSWRARGWLQRGRVDLRRPGIGCARLRPPHPVHLQNQPQRTAELPEQLRPDSVRYREAGAGSGRRRSRCHHLLRLCQGVPAPDVRGRGPAACHPGCVSRPWDHACLSRRTCPRQLRCTRAPACRNLARSRLTNTFRYSRLAPSWERLLQQAGDGPGVSSTRLVRSDMHPWRLRHNGSQGPYIWNATLRPG
jgi:hypothetical protein